MDIEEVYNSVEEEGKDVSLEPLVRYKNKNNVDLENVLTKVVDYLRSENDTETAYHLVDNYNNFFDAMDAQTDVEYEELTKELEKN